MHERIAGSFGQTQGMDPQPAAARGYGQPAAGAAPAFSFNVVDVAAGQLSTLGPYEFPNVRGDEILRLNLGPCQTDALMPATRDIVKVDAGAGAGGMKISLVSPSAGGLLMNRRKKEHVPDSSFATSRRRIISGACGVAGAIFAVVGGLLATLPGSASAALPAEGAAREVLYIEGVAAGVITSREGGTPFVETRVLATPEPPFFRNVAGTVRPEPIALKFGSGLSGNLYQWVQEALHPKTMLNRKSGYLAFADSDSKETGRLSFYDALISDITLPALDLASRDAAALTIKLAPQGTQLQMGSGSTLPFGVTSVKAGVSWGANGFAVTIDGGGGQQITTSTVLAVEPHTTTFKVADPGQERVGTQVLPLPGPLVLIVREDGARQYIDWFNQLWGGPQTDPDWQQQYLRTLTLSFVRRDPMSGAIVATYGTATFHQVGISRVSPVPFQSNDRWRKVKVELYASALTLDIKGLAGT